MATCHEATSIADQEERCAPELLGLAQPFHHVDILPQRLEVRLIVEVLLDHWSVDVARAQRVDPDSVLGPLHGQVPAELDDRCFGAVVHWGDEALDLSAELAS